MANEGVDSQRPGELARVNQGLEKRNPIQDYQAAKAALENAWGQVEQDFADQVLDEEGRELPHQNYLAGLKVGKKIVGEDAQILQGEILQGLSDKLGAFSDNVAPPMNMTAVGIVSAGLNLPIVDVPNVDLKKLGLNDEQLQELEELQRTIARSGSVLLQLNFQPGSIKGGIVQSNMPEGLVMEDDPDTKIQISFTPGFKSGRDMAKNVFDIVMEADSLKAIGLQKSNFRQEK